MAQWRESALSDRELSILFQETMAFAGLGLLRYTLDNRIAFMDTSALHILELAERFSTPNDILGRNIHEIITDALPWDLLRDEVKKCGYVRDFEHRFQTRSGQSKWVLAHSCLVQDPGSGQETVQVVLLDITGRKRAEEALQDALSRFEAMVNNAPMVAIQGFDREGRVRHWNHAAEQLFGFSAQEMMGQPLAGRTLQGEAAYEFEQMLAAVWKTGQPAEPREWPVRHQNGEERWVYSSLFPLLKQGVVTEVFCLNVDITVRKKSDQERRRLESQIQHTQRLESLGVLAGGVAHEFNNILMGILGHAELALMDLRDSARMEGHLNQIVRSTERAADLTRQLLTYSGQGNFFFQAINLSSLIHDMAHLFEVSKSKKVDILYDLAPGLPPIEGDAAQLHQVILNLITNAAEAIGGSMGTIYIRTGVRKCTRDFLAQARYAEYSSEGEYVFLEVADTGCGIDENTQEKIFDPFFTTKFIGRGLGLSATVGIVRAHQGIIKAESIPSKGTTFTLLFPLMRKGAVSEPVAADAPPKYGLVLLVDDEIQVRTVVREILEQSGFTVITAKDGVEGVDLFQQYARELALVILDLKMPRMDGEEAFLAMRQIREDVPIILSSGYGEIESMRRFDGKGVTAFAQKPYQAQTLLKKIQEILVRQSAYSS